MLNKLGLLVAALAAIALCIYCAAAHGLPIQDMIQMNAAERIEASGMSEAHVVADGRDLTLKGTVDSQEAKQQAGELAASAPGVRTVDNQLEVNQPHATPATPDAKTVQTTINRILLDKRIEFQTNRDILLPQSVPVLDEVLKVLKQAPQLSIRIEGHTDSMGSPDMNRTLSKARAEAVMNWFADHGIEKPRMKAPGFGADKPIASNTTSAGRFANRRVEIITN